ncbi:MAG: hypothetical protein R6V35_02680 [Candidatus Nanohaloarchaea archaeon]
MTMRIETLLKRLKREYWKIKALQSSLDTLILVLGLNFLAFLASFEYDFRILGGIAAVFFLGNLIYRTRGYSVEIYEDQNDELQELLRTARDNLDKRDTVSEALFGDVMERARTVSSESIIPSERIVQKLFLVGGLAILTTVSGLIVPVIDVDASGAYDRISDIVGSQDDGDDFRGNASDVLGEESDLDDTGSDVDIEIVGEGESFEESVLRGFEGDRELMYEASPEIEEDSWLMREYSLAIRDIE